MKLSTLTLALLAAIGFAAHAEVPRDAQIERIDATRVALVWTPVAGEDGDYRIVLSDPDGAPAGARARTVAAASGRLELAHPADARPYVTLVDGEGERITVGERVLPLEGGVNFRDLGGYRTADGRSVKWGRLFRSGVMDSLTDGDYAYLQRLGVKTVCDFRSSDERARAPTAAQRIAPGGRYLSWDYELGLDRAAFAQAFGAGGDPAQAAQRLMTGFYRQMPTVFAPRFREVFDALKGGDGLLFHCSAGKDRTGLMAALLLSALGVEQEQILVDFAMSDRVESLKRLHVRYQQGGNAEDDPARAMFAKLPPEATQALMASDPAYLAAALDQIRTDHGSIDGYLEHELGVSPADRARLQAEYLEPATARSAPDARR